MFQLHLTPLTAGITAAVLLGVGGLVSVQLRRGRAGAAIREVGIVLGLFGLWMLVGRLVGHHPAGGYARGADISRQALDACGDTKTLDPCGYAAYELGKALNRSGQPDAAIPYLEQRLSYGSNPEAEKELKDARKNAGK